MERSPGPETFSDAEAQLDAIKQELERNEFVNLVAHELKNPLTTISGAAQLLEMEMDQLPERSKKAVELLLRQTARAQTLIKDLLDLSRLRSGRFSIAPTELDLRREVEEALATLPPPEGKTVQVEVDDGVRVVADQGRLAQILANLLTNAYAYGGSAIQVAADRGAGMVSVSVVDDGDGLPPEYFPHLFEPFVRGDSSGQAGSGLGLAITRGLVEAHHGSIRYEPREPSGARFVFELKATGSA